MRMLICLWICLSLVFSLTGCGGGGGASNVASGPGTVRHFQVEGGGFKLVGDTGTAYLPDNLAPAFQQDGLRVFFTGHLTGAPTALQVDVPIHLEEIHLLP